MFKLNKMSQQEKSMVKTNKLLLIGRNVEKSLSPSIFKNFSKNTGIKLEYRLKSLSHSAFLNFNFKNKKLIGFNVTNPYKNEIINFLDKIDSTAKAIGAVNTVLIKNDKLTGFNTDAEGFTRFIELTWPNLNKNISKRRILILGAGGVSAAIIFALKKHGARNISVLNRSQERAEALTKRFKISKLNFPKDNSVDFLINATSIESTGKKMNDKNLKILKNALTKDAIVFDAAYSKQNTNFIKYFLKSGFEAKDGKGMLRTQAALAFKIWFKILPNLNL